MAKRRRKRKSGCFKFAFWLLFLIFLIMILFVIVLAKGDLQTKVKEAVQEHTVKEVPYEEVKIKESAVGKKFYYEQLSEEEKTIYKEILQGVEANSKEIYTHCADANRTNELFELVLKDNPGIFWCDGMAKATQYEGDEAYTVLSPAYVYGTEKRDEMQTEIDAQVEKCLRGMEEDGIDENASDYEKILSVFEYIVDTVDYDAKASDNQNIYSVFVGKRSVCAGYAKATQYLLEKQGVFCAYITGKTRTGASHAWNLVLCDGDYYYVDTTWGDPVFLEKEQAIDYNSISYDYLCCNDEQLKKTHIPDSDIKLPECKKMTNNYYVVNNLYYTEYDKDVILTSMKDTISAKGNPSVFKFADEDAYKKAKGGIFGELIEKAAQSLAQMYNLKQVKYTYMDDEELNKIVIYWKYE